MGGKWSRQSQIAARTVRTNELLRATDVEVQRQENACLGTADNLEIDAVRLVLTGEYDVARQYFRAVRELSAAAIERGETWVYTDAFFARCEALRLRMIASWALGLEDAPADATAALGSWGALAETEISFDPSRRNAHTILGLLAAHSGDFMRAFVAVRSVKECDPPTAWCELLSLIDGLNSSASDKADRWNNFFATAVVTAANDQLVADEFNVGEACMIANVRAAVNGWKLDPFETIELLRQ